VLYYALRQADITAFMPFTGYDDEGRGNAGAHRQPYVRARRPAAST
jgi:hypothetical protein